MNSSTKTTTLVIGTLLGALLGYSAAKILVKQSEESGGKAPITASQGLQVGLSALGMLRQISGGGK